MTAATQEVVQVVEALTEEDRKLVLAFANALREREALELPKTERTDEPAWLSWIARMQARGTQAIARELERLRAAGLADERGPLPLSSLPEDMKPDSGTSVGT